MSNTIPVVTEETFDEVVIEASSARPVAVKFTGDWCPPCKVLAPVLEAIAAEMADVAFVQIELNDRETFDVWKERMHIRGIPTLIVFRNGKEVDRIVGFDASAGKAGYESELRRLLA